MKLNLNTSLGKAYGHVVARQSVACGDRTAGGIFLDGSAAIRFEDLDISPYAGVAGTLTNYKIRLLDNDLYVCEGYLAEADAALALGEEEIKDNADFTAQGSWICEDETITVADGKGKFTNTTNAKSLYQVDALTTPDYKLYKVVFTIDSITGGSLSYLLGNTTSGKQRSNPGIHTEYLLVESTINNQINFITITGDTLTAVIDNASVKEVTALGVDGCHVVSTKNGSTQNWESQHASFNYNDDPNYRAEILIAK